MMLCVVLSLGVSFFVVVYDQAKYREAVESRELSLKLAEELRQSSSDLARLVRTYVITGKQIYKDQFHAIVDIRKDVEPDQKTTVQPTGNIMHLLRQIGPK